MERQGFDPGGMPRYHVRTRDSLVGQAASRLHAGRQDPMSEQELFVAALQQMDGDGWKLVAAAGEALLFRARHRAR